MQFENENVLYGCAFGCPAQSRLKDCPFIEFDHLSLKGKVIHMNEIDKEKKDSLTVHHAFCSRNRK